jgi:urease accessory protein
VRAAATFAVRRDGGGQRTYWRDAPPVVLRPTGTDRLHLLHAAGGPLGGDDLLLTGTVGAACDVRVDSAGATVVQPGRDGSPADWAVHLDVAAGAAMRWAPQPTVVCAGADFRGSLRATVAEDGLLVVRETVVLGRSGETGGRYAGLLSVTVGGRPLVVHENLLDGADAALSGPAGSGGHRVQGSVLVCGRGVEPPSECAGRQGDVSWAVLPLDGPGYLVLAVGPLVTGVSAVLDGPLAGIRSGTQLLQ